MTYVNFFTLIYGWIGLWCVIASALMLSRRGKNWADYDVIFFRVAVGAVSISVFVNRFFSPADDLYLWAMIIFHLLLAYAATATALRVAWVIHQKKFNHETTKEDVERRHREIIAAFPGVGHETQQDITDDSRSEDPLH